MSGIAPMNWVTMRIYSEDLHPTEIASLIGIDPTKIVIKGDRKSERAPPFKRGAWLWSSEKADIEDTLDAHLAWLADAVGDFDQLRSALEKAGLEASFVAYHWPTALRAFALSSRARLILARLPGEFWLHVAEYPDDM